MQPRMFAFGRIRQGVEAIQASLVDELRQIDDEVVELVRRREEIVEDLRLCRDALGDGSYRWRRRVPLPGDIDAVPEDLRSIAGADLRDTIVDVLRSAERPLTLREIHRSLLARGRNVDGRPSKSVADSLRTAVKRGDVRRVSRGVYAAAST